MIKQLKETLIGKEEKFSRLNEGNKKIKQQQIIRWYRQRRTESFKKSVKTLIIRSKRMDTI
jgi:hypothetical protein